MEVLDALLVWRESAGREEQSAVRYYAVGVLSTVRLPRVRREAALALLLDFALQQQGEPQGPLTAGRSTRIYAHSYVLCQ